MGLSVLSGAESWRHGFRGKMPSPNFYVFKADMLTTCKQESTSKKYAGNRVVLVTFLEASFGHIQPG